MKVEFNDKELKQLFTKLKKHSTTLTPAMRDISIFMKTEVMKNFRAQGRPSKWPDLANSTKKQKIRKKGTAYPILEFTGRLKQSINARHSKNEAAVSAGVKYAQYHMKGSGKMPARPFMPTDESSNIPPFDKSSIERMKSMIIDFIKKVIE